MAPSVRSAVQALCRIFTERFTADKRTCGYIFLRPSSISPDQTLRLPGQESPMWPCTGRNTFRWTRVSNLWPDCPALPLSSDALFQVSSQQRLHVPLHAPIGFYDGVDRLQSASLSTGDRCPVTQSCYLAIPSQIHVHVWDRDRDATCVRNPCFVATNLNALAIISPPAKVTLAWTPGTRYI